MSDSPEQVREVVKERYARLAVQPLGQAATDSCCADDGCCGQSDAEMAALYGQLYSADTSWLPVEVTGLSLGCGDPITLAALETGQTVLDMGSGGGIDCFMAARQVGPAGHVIGVDMTPEMLDKANHNRDKLGLSNVEFRAGLIEALPVEDESVDVIISNCVINLSPDKTAVFREAYRVLKSGGRLAVSDMVTVGQFTAAERADLSAWAGCVTGAEDVADYAAIMREAGFRSISIRDKADAGETELADAAKGEGPAKLFSARLTAVK